MRVLWVCRRSSGEGAGDSLYDDKLVAALRARCDVEVYGLARNPRAKQLTRAALHLSLPEQYGIGDKADIARLREMLPKFDVAVFSHEHTDTVARAVRSATTIPFIALRHNVTSDSMASILRGMAPLDAVYRALAEAQEKSALRGALYQEITAISVGDQRLLRQLSGRGAIVIIPPGAPSAAALNDDATFKRELVISGTFDWFPKARDLRRFANDYAQDPVANTKLRCSSSSAATIRAALGAAHDDGYDPADGIRAGVITDRFTAGHKLKTAAYIMGNCAVISFARISGDFIDLPNYRNWIFEVSDAAEIAPIMDRLAARPADEMRGELTALKSAVAEKFNWAKSGALLADVIEETTARAETSGRDNQLQ
jgi:glycosyltransferase involved in cell wall biosynthesis